MVYITVYFTHLPWHKATLSKLLIFFPHRRKHFATTNRAIQSPNAPCCGSSKGSVCGYFGNCNDFGNHTNAASAESNGTTSCVDRCRWSANVSGRTNASRSKFGSDARWKNGNVHHFCLYSILKCFCVDWLVYLCTNQHFYANLIVHFLNILRLVWRIWEESPVAL